MTHVFHRDLKAKLPTAVRGEGVLLFDASGKAYLDASGGAAVSCLGHGHPAVVRAIKDQVDRIAYAHSGFFTTESMEALADALVEASPRPLDHVYFLSGGSEAIEAALKMARQYFLEIGQPARRHIIARWQSFHGNTLGALAVGGNRLRRAPFEPLLAKAHHVAPCYAYRGKVPGESDEAYGLRVAAELEAKILELGPETVAAFVAEPVVGATLGAVPPVPGYFREVRRICDKYGVLLVLDEVMCGMGRTGTLFACEQDGVVPDLLVMGKGLAAGYQPIAALLVASRVYQAFAAGSGAFQHGHTYMGHATACAAALAVLRTIREEELCGRVRRQGKKLHDALATRFHDHPFVGDVRGRGLFLGLEIVADRATRAPFDPARRTHARIKRAAMERGLICYPMGGTIDGNAGDHVLLAPPFLIEDGHIEQIVDRIGAAIDASVVD